MREVQNDTYQKLVAPPLTPSTFSIHGEQLMVSESEQVIQGLRGPEEGARS